MSKWKSHFLVFVSACSFFLMRVKSLESMQDLALLRVRCSALQSPTHLPRFHTLGGINCFCLAIGKIGEKHLLKISKKMTRFILFIPMLGTRRRKKMFLLKLVISEQHLRRRFQRGTLSGPNFIRKKAALWGFQY